MPEQNSQPVERTEGLFPREEIEKGPEARSRAGGREEPGPLEVDKKDGLEALRARGAGEVPLESASTIQQPPTAAELVASGGKEQAEVVVLAKTASPGEIEGALRKVFQAKTVK